MHILFLFLLILVVPLAVWQIAKFPFYGILLLLVVTPLEALIHLPAGLTAGRFIGFMAIGGWFLYLQRNHDAWRRLQNSSLARRVWVFPVVCLFGAVLASLRWDDYSGFPQAVNIALLSLMALMIDNLAIDRRHLYLLTLTVVLASMIAAIFPLAFHFGIDLYSPLGFDPALSVRTTRVRGLISNENGLGLMAVMGIFGLIVCFPVTRWKWIMGVLVAILFALLFVLFLSGSRTNFIAVVACLATYWLLRVFGPRKGMGYSILAALGIAALIPLAYREAPEVTQERMIVVGGDVRSDTYQRYEFAQNQRRQAINIMLESPFGIGLYAYRVRFPDGSAAHDSFSMLVGETGVLGTLAIFWILIYCFRQLIRASIGWRKHHNLELYYYSLGLLASLVAMLVAGFGGYLFPYQRWFWIVVGLSPVIGRWSEHALRLPCPFPMPRSMKLITCLSSFRLRLRQSPAMPKSR